jgi:hypothetical protein
MIERLGGVKLRVIRSGASQFAAKEGRVSPVSRS